MLEDDTEDIIITKINPPKPPPPPPPPPVEIVVVEDTVEDIEETIFESTETDQEEIVEVEDIEIEEEWEDVDIPFAVVEQKPSFPGSTPARFQQDINNHIRKHFRYPPAAQELGIQGRVYISFIILKDGSIKIKGYRGPDRNLEREALRILSKLPIMEPGKQRNQPVNVPFSLPITFRIQ